jgi:hypothetical protein
MWCVPTSADCIASNSIHSSGTVRSSTSGINPLDMLSDVARLVLSAVRTLNREGANRGGVRSMVPL